MNNGQSKGRGWLTILLVSVLVIVTSIDLRRASTTLVIDKRGTIRLGGMVPLRNKRTRDSVLQVVGHLNGARFKIVANESANFSSVVEALDSISKAHATLAPTPRRSPEK
jgi:biopolymer transport protein ExbD